MTKEQIEYNLNRLEIIKKEANLKKQKAKDIQLDNKILKERARTNTQRIISKRNVIKGLILKTNNKWEVSFLTSIVYRNNLSIKQQNILKQIAKKLAQ
tara:strand:+ start:1163 stop:1456 length:294 start_codon:yes stop_codon:yes gene_type:complete